MTWDYSVSVKRVTDNLQKNPVITYRYLVYYLGFINILVCWKTPSNKSSVCRPDKHRKHYSPWIYIMNLTYLKFWTVHCHFLGVVGKCKVFNMQSFWDLVEGASEQANAFCYRLSMYLCVRHTCRKHWEWADCFFLTRRHKVYSLFLQSNDKQQLVYRVLHYLTRSMQQS